MHENPPLGLFTSFTKEAFRFETLAQYLVPEEEDELARYLSGEPLPKHDRHQEWLDALDGWGSQGKGIVRVRLLPAKLTLYQEFELAWGYPYNSEHGERIRVVAEDAFRTQFNTTAHDWWLFDDMVAADMKYTADGEFIGAALVSDALPYQAMRNWMLQNGMSLNEYFRQRRDV